MTQGSSSGAGTAPAAAPSGNAGGRASTGGGPAPTISPRAGHPGSTHTGVESGRNAGLVASARGEFGGWESKPNDITGIKPTKTGASSADSKADAKGIKIETPTETRSAFDYMQPGKIIEKAPEEAAQSKQTSGEDEQKLPGGHDPGLTPEQLAGMLTGRRSLLQAVHKYGRVGLDGTPYYIQLQELNKQLGLSENDMGGYTIGGGGGD